MPWQNHERRDPDPKVESFGTATVNLRTPEGNGKLTLLDVAYIPGFLTNVVSLDRLNAKGIHWNSRRPTELEKDGKVIAYLEQEGKHRTLERNLLFRDSIPGSYASMSTTTRSKRSDRGVRKSSKPVETTVSPALAHKIMGHASPEVIGHLEDAVQGLKVDEKSAKCPTSIECVTCARCKPTQIISRRSETEEAIETKPGMSWAWDMIHEIPAYNGDRYCSHFQCLNTRFNMVYTHSHVSDTIHIIREAFKLIRNVHGYNPKHIQLDGATSLPSTLHSQWRELIASLGIQERRTAPYTPEQSKAERSGHTLTVKAHAMIGEASIPHNMWPEAYRMAGYVANRTPIKKLAWKTPFEGFTKDIPMLGHVHPFGCRAYAVEDNIPKLEKMAPRAQVGYLVGFDSTNIFRVWLPSKGRVIRTRDVRFDDTKLYHPSDLELGALQGAQIAEVVQTLEIPDAVSDRDWAREDQEYDSDTIVVDTSSVGVTTPSSKEGGKGKENSENGHTPETTPDEEDSPGNKQLPTPTSSKTLSRMLSPFDKYANGANTPLQGSSNASNAQEQELHQPEQSGNSRAVSAGFSESNILPEGTRRITRASQRHALATRYSQLDHLEEAEEEHYHAAFSAAAHSIPQKVHISELL